MKPFKINRNSWHYKLNKSFFNSYEWRMPRWEEDHSDFCSYWRATLIRMIGAAVVIAILGVPVGVFLYGLITAPMATLGGIVFIVACFAIAVGLWFGGERFARWRRSRTERQPGLIATKYQSWKGQYCPPAEYADE